MLLAGFDLLGIAVILREAIWEARAADILLSRPCIGTFSKYDRRPTVSLILACAQLLVGLLRRRTVLAGEISRVA